MATVSIKTSKSFTTTTKIPGDLQNLLEDKDNNGTPDVVDQMLQGQGSTTSTEEIVINGQKYNSWDEVPSEFQKFRSLTSSSKSPDNSFEKPLPYENLFFIREVKLYAIAISIVLAICFLTKYLLVL